jgi:hypothetical protein
MRVQTEIVREKIRQELLELARWITIYAPDAGTKAWTDKELFESVRINLLGDDMQLPPIVNFYELDWVNSVVINIANNYREGLKRLLFIPYKGKSG